MHEVLLPFFGCKYLRNEMERTAEQENPVINLRLFIADRMLCS